MDSHIVKVLNTEFITHNVKHFTVEKPPVYTFISGQATDVSINKKGLEEELRPFTFTSVNSSENLEFCIKIYTGHNGVTEKLLEVNEGDELILHEVFGTITYHGPGLFIAAGAGITPFISIFRQLQLDNKLQGNILLFANRTSADIILKDELRELLGEHFINVIEDQGAEKKFIDQQLLGKYITSSQNYYYICGPDKFTTLMVEYLHELKVEGSKIIIEQ